MAFKRYALNLRNPWDPVPSIAPPAPPPEPPSELDIDPPSEDVEAVDVDETDDLFITTMPTLPVVRVKRNYSPVYPVNAPQRNVIDALHFQTYPYPPTFDPQVAGLGETAAPLDLVGMMRDMYSSYKSVQPTIDFWGAHPMMTLTLVLAAIIAGGAVGGYIGAGYKATPKRS